MCNAEATTELSKYPKGNDTAVRTDSCAAGEDARLPTVRQEREDGSYLQMKRSWRRAAATLPTGRRAGKEMKIGTSGVGADPCVCPHNRGEHAGSPLPTGIAKAFSRLLAYIGG
jgi:hypothetical protein